MIFRRKFLTLRPLNQKIFIFSTFLMSILPADRSCAKETSDPQSLNALHILQERAESGNAKAQYALGHIYSHGLGVQQDDVKAIEWIEKAAFQGNAYAEDALGLAYAGGMRGKKQDYTQAKEWFEKSAAQNDAYGQAHLGHAYARGAGIKKDCDQALYWLEKAARRTWANDEGEELLANLYEDGVCVERNLDVAADLYQKSCKQENEDGCAGYERVKAAQK
ncbi:sel1 repeat family protein [Acetobacteraceae bacterium]|nr:sel1 repeat family protein [Acetobacteraceae bacterium]